MVDLMSVFNDVSLTVKVLWAVWMMWAVAQFVWLRRARVVAAPPRTLPSPSYGAGQRRSAPVSNQPLRQDVAKLQEAVAQRKMREAAASATPRANDGNVTVVATDSVRVAS
jgi:hypothetical protein